MGLKPKHNWYIILVVMQILDDHQKKISVFLAKIEDK